MTSHLPGLALTPSPAMRAGTPSGLAALTVRHRHGHPVDQPGQLPGSLPQPQLPPPRGALVAPAAPRRRPVRGCPNEAPARATSTAATAP